MRISDWSSDVCSSDLGGLYTGVRASACEAEQRRVHPAAVAQLVVHFPHQPVLVAGGVEHHPDVQVAHRAALAVGLLEQPRRLRSEEHTSELQSPMRTSYAACCL